MGHGGGVARADTTFTYPKITVVNGGAQRVFAYTVLNNPARVQTPVIGTITKLSGRWSYRLHVVIPKVLQVVAGRPARPAVAELPRRARETGWPRPPARPAAAGRTTP